MKILHLVSLKLILIVVLLLGYVPIAFALYSNVSINHAESNQLNLTNNLPDNVLDDSKWSYGWRDEGTANTKPKVSVIRSAFNKRDALQLDFWYPNSSGEFVDRLLSNIQNGDSWAVGEFQYISFWYKAVDTQGDIEIRLNKGNRLWKSKVTSYFTKVNVTPGSWNRVVIPFEQFRLDSKNKKPLKNTHGIKVLSIGYKNHELRKPGKIQFSEFVVGKYGINSEFNIIKLPETWRFKLDNMRPNGEKNSFEEKRDKEGYGKILGYHKLDFDYSNWNILTVGKSWEKQGIMYNGPAWYKTSVFIPKSWSNSSIILNAGKPDDREELYFNGKLIKTINRFGPAFSELQIEPANI